MSLLLLLVTPLAPAVPASLAQIVEPGPLSLGSTVWGDWNGDGLLDLYVVGRGEPDRLLGNLGDGTFTDLTDSLGLALLEGARTTRFADFDADGHVDLLRVSAEGALVLERNVGGVGFAPAALEGGLDREKIGLLAAEWIDYDRDGYLDLALLTLVGQELYHNRAGRAFERVPLPLSAPTFVVDHAVQAGPAGVPRAELRVGRDGAPLPATAAPAITPGGVTAGPGTSEPASLLCLESIRDLATGGCLTASSLPLPGLLYPLGPELNIDLFGRVGIGTMTPSEQLDVAGTVRADGLRMPPGAQAGYVLTTDASGNASWQPGGSSTGVGGSGTSGYLARFTAATTVGDTVAYESGGRLGIGTTSPAAGLHVHAGPLDIGTGTTSNLRIEGVASDGTGGTIDFGSAGPGPDTYLSQNASSQLEVISDTGVLFGPGNVGVKTDELTHSLNVGASASSQALRLLGTQPYYAGARLSFGDGDYCMIEEQSDDKMYIRSLLGITLERATPQDARTLTVKANGGGASTNAAIYASNLDVGNSMALAAEAWGTGTAVQLNNRGTGTHLACSAGAGNVFEVKHSGRVVTTALEVTGGGDLVEAFETSGDAPEPGTVMAIDPTNPGKLVPSSVPYDRRVAGAVSGAGGVAHGIQLGQRGVLDGDTLVAMAGRIYVRCTTANGAIEPGDRLTTSGVPGIAMKATDTARASGAVLGKAMSALAEGDGLVLVLIDLQ